MASSILGKLSLLYFNDDDNAVPVQNYARPRCIRNDSNLKLSQDLVLSRSMLGSSELAAQIMRPF